MFARAAASIDYPNQAVASGSCQEEIGCHHHHFVCLKNFQKSSLCLNNFKKNVICFGLTWIKFAWQGLRFFVPVWNLIAIFSMKLGLHVKSSGTCLRVLVQSLDRDSVCNIVIATYQKHCNCNISKAQQ